MIYSVIVDDYKEILIFDINNRVPVGEHLSKIQEYMKKHDLDAQYLITSVDKYIKM